MHLLQMLAMSILHAEQMGQTSNKQHHCINASELMHTHTAAQLVLNVSGLTQAPRGSVVWTVSTFLPFLAAIVIQQITLLVYWKCINKVNLHDIM